jgi:transcriptional regulator with XRE-family HTH domain
VYADAGGFVFSGLRMETIGKALREAREQLGLTLDQVERSTRIRKVRLEALEAGDFASLPSQVQVQGFLRNYADFLGLDHEHILDLYREQEGLPQKQSIRRAQATPTSSISPKPRRFRLYGDQVITGIMALAVIAILVWGTNRIFSGVDQTGVPQDLEEPTALASPTEMPTSTPQLAGMGELPPEATLDTGPPPTATLTLGLVDSIELEIIAEQSAFLQVLVDGEEEYQGRLLEGESLNVRGEERVEVITGNARGLRVRFNGQDQGYLGDVNQVITRIWTIRGIQTPTPTQTLTPTATPPETETATPTITPVGSGGEGL